MSLRLIVAEDALLLREGLVGLLQGTRRTRVQGASTAAVAPTLTAAQPE